MVRVSAPRAFVIGDTVHFRSRVSLPGTSTPTDPALVVLSTLSLAGTSVLVAPLPFTRELEGEYVLSLPTDNLVVGVYDVSVTHSSGPSMVTVVTDQFVLQTA